MLDEDDRLTFYYNGDPGARVFQVVKEVLKEKTHPLVNHYDEFLIDVYMLLDKRKSYYVAIDWDNTISADQEFFIELIKRVKLKGYIPFICTLRSPDKENINEIKNILEETLIPIYLTNGRPKRKYMKSLGVKVLLWIDDFYPGICGDSCKILARNNIE